MGDAHAGDDIVIDCASHRVSHDNKSADTIKDETVTTTPQAEVWLRGPIDGYEPLVMPAVHSLLQVREDAHRLLANVPEGHVWQRPGGAASIGFHLRHTGGALDRLLTYARGEALSEVQKEFLRTEAVAGEPLADLVRTLDRTIDRACDQLRSTSAGMLVQFRSVGRAALPSSIGGLIFHAAEHSTRHLGQAITTARILAGTERKA
jgi:hypothetical protein